MNYMSIAFTDRGWEVSYRGVENKDFRISQHDDVVCAIRGAMTGRVGAEPKPERPKRAKKAVAQRSSANDDILEGL